MKEATMTAETLRSQDFAVLLSNAFGMDKVEDTRKVFEFALNTKRMKQEVVDDLQDKLASRDFVRAEIAEVRQEIAELRTELKQDIADVRQEIADVRQEIAELRTETKQDIARLDLKIEKKFSTLKNYAVTIVILMIVLQPKVFDFLTSFLK